MASGRLPMFTDEAGADAAESGRLNAVQGFDTIAAIDLGSNSFRMVVARVGDHELHVIDRMRERVALADGLDKKRILSEEAIERALACLRRFGQRLWAVPTERTRAVGTQTLRAAKNAAEFVQRAEQALGHPIEIVSGKEEARLIYSGVVHGMPGITGRRLVVDIGGGSTECVIGDSLEPLRADSLQMGCVSYTKRFFPDGKITRARMNDAMMAARAELQGIDGEYRNLGWEHALGSSGTILAVANILREHGWSTVGIGMKELRRLRKTIRDAGASANLATLPGLQPDRVPVIAAGVCILQAVFDSLKVEHMRVSSWALREGILFDLIGRIQHEDIRDRTIQALVDRYHVDLSHASRVERTALAMLDQCAAAWGIDPVVGRQYLRWASKLHEIGLSISYSGYHKHSSYIISQSDLPGFGRTDQRLLGQLLLNHRRKPRFTDLALLPPYLQQTTRYLCVLLRIAVALNRGRASIKGYSLKINVDGDKVKLRFPDEFLHNHPLTRVDLEEEVERLKQVGISLSFK